jgi:hypothetical protein
VVSRTSVARALLVAASAGCSLVTGFDDLDPSLEECLPGTTRACYEGPAGTDGVGVCTAGVATCSDDGSGYGPCEGQTIPSTDDCATPSDESCGVSSCGSDGGGGGVGMTTTTMSTTSTSCTPQCASKRCGDDGCGGLCNGIAMPDAFALNNLGGEVTSIAPWPETQSVFVGDSDGGIYRIDTCDGSIMAEAHVDAALPGAPASTEALALLDNELAAVATNEDRASYLSYAPDDLAYSGVKLDLLSDGISGMGGGIEVDDRLVVNYVNGAIASSVANMGTCNLPFGGTGYNGRGLTSDGAEIFYVVASSMPTYRLFAGCTNVCFCPKEDIRIGPYQPQGLHYFDPVWTGSRLVVVGFRNSGDREATLAAFDVTTLDGAPELRIDPTGSLDVFLSASHQGGFIYAAGSAGAETTIPPPEGLGWIARVPDDFTSTTPETELTEAVIPSALRLSRVVADDTGVFVGGAAAGGGVFAKCRHDLSNCGAP